MFLRTVLLPIIILIFWGLGSVIMMQLGNIVGGVYSSVDGIIEWAVETQEDLARNYYGGIGYGNVFDIGEFDASFSGILSKAQPALIAGLYRPFLWEAQNPVMLIAGIENFAMLLLSLYVLLLACVAIFKTGPGYMLRTMFDNSLIVFSFVFAITFAFSVGLATANFGALVRY
ncbi:unnamed protein product, partial [marine sediment metagenome]